MDQESPNENEEFAEQNKELENIREGLCPASKK